MQPALRTFPETRFIGMSRDMTFQLLKTVELWRQFMPRRKEIAPLSRTELFSMELYEPDFFVGFSPQRTFQKRAGVAVEANTLVPEGMEEWTVPEGLYAVFLYTGRNTEAAPFYSEILTRWLPRSGYQLDHRPHMAIMDHRYKNDDPDSQEEIWIPIRANTQET